jgi:hypothetical protein
MWEVIGNDWEKQTEKVTSDIMQLYRLQDRNRISTLKRINPNAIVLNMMLNSRRQLLSGGHYRATMIRNLIAWVDI